MLSDVKAALAAISGEGSFAVERACPSGDLRLTVKGVGPIDFPIRPAVARRLRAAARPAPFGKRDQTVYDTSVRDTWEIGKERIEVDARRWARTLRPQLEAIQKGLGLPGGAKLVARLDKMLVYEPGQFFAPHQDSERSRDMVGSLVVELPSASAGGSVVVEHGGEKLVFKGAERGPTDLSLLAFYADCHHEVLPIESGFRVVLTYQLLHRAGPRPAGPPDPTAAVDRLAGAVKAFFERPIERKYSTAPAQRPGRLVYLLDHEYTEQSLGWDRLKNADRLRAAALVAAADRLDCEVFLALADVHENWMCEGGEDWGGWGRRRYGYADEYDEDEWDDEDDGDGDEDYELIELIEDDVELRHWLDRDGKPAGAIAGRRAGSVSVAPEHEEICFTRPSSEMSPFKSEYEGYQGNYGNTLDRWYHRAAVVMWPREHSFVLRAKVSPAWAVRQILSLLEKGKTKEARERAHSLLPFWRGPASQEQSEPFTRDVIAAAAALGGAGLAHDLLAPLGPDRLGKEAAPAFARLVEQLGETWAKKLFGTWLGRWRYDEPGWWPRLPGICEALAREANRHGHRVAMWLLAREIGAFIKGHQLLLERLPPQATDEKFMVAHRRDLEDLLSAAGVLEAAALRDDLIVFLTTPGTALPPLEAGELLRQIRQGGGASGKRSPAEVRALGLGALYRHTVSALEALLAAPPRSPDDWSMELGGKCKCELCSALAAFLRAPDRIEHRWPLAERKRAHIHLRIDGEKLPVSHVTERRGSPYTLVLKKQPSLFERARETRARQKELLAWLRRNAGAFEEAG